MWSNSLIQLKLKPDSYEFGFFYDWQWRRVRDSNTQTWNSLLIIDQILETLNPEMQQVGILGDSSSLLQ